MPKTSDMDKAEEQRRGQEAEDRRMASVARVVFFITIFFVLGMCVYVFLVSP